MVVDGVTEINITERATAELFAHAVSPKEREI